MQQFIEISLSDKPMGVISWDNVNQSGIFEYLPGFNSDKEVLHFNSIDNLPSFLKDVLPGDFAFRLLRYYLQKSGKSPENLSPVAILSLIGNRSFGAYKFNPQGFPEFDLSEQIEIDRLHKSIQHILDKGVNELHDKKLRDVLRAALFSNSDDPELLLAINDFNGEVLSGQAKIPNGFNGWRLKLDGLMTAVSKRINLEYEYYLKALKCGINIAEHRILKEGHNKHLLIERIDRQGDKRIHLMSFASFFGDNKNEFSDVFKCMRMLNMPYQEWAEMFKRISFILISNEIKENSRNIYFRLNENNKWSLAKAGEIMPSVSKRNTIMCLNGKSNNVSKNELISFGKSQGIKKAEKIVNEIIEVLQP